jgi:streptogramin lyase
MRTREIQIRTTGRILVALCALGVCLAFASAAHATTYNVEGAFDESQFNLGVAVDQASGDVYVANFFGGTEKFSAAGQLEAPTPFVTVTTEADEGVAVDPLNQNVYVYTFTEKTHTQAIETYTPSGTKVGSFNVPGSEAIVEIASDSNGDVYFPDKEANTVLKFSPAGTLEATIEGQAPVGAFKEPQGVAVDASGNIYVADTGNGRTVRIEAGTGAQSVVDTGGTQDVAVDPVSGDVFALDLSEEGSCGALPTPCYRVRDFHRGETTPFAEFGAGTIHHEGPPNHLAIDHNNSKVYVSDFQDKVWIFGPGTPPEVTYPTPFVTGLSASEATLDGEVNPRGNETSCHFEYGTSTTYEHSVPCEGEHGDFVGEGSKAKPEAVTIKGLEGNTEYHFRLVATTAAATIEGADETFTTLPAPPVVLASSVLASEVTQSDVVFNATLNPQDLDTHYYFNYGLHPFEDSSTCAPPGTVPYASAPATPIDIGTAHSISEEAAGLAVSPFDLEEATVLLHPGMDSRALAPNTVYRFQVVAENAAGTICEPEATFITLPPDPAVSTGGASEITRTAANLAGTVMPDSTGPNSDTTWGFQYGTSTAYTGGSVPATPGDAGIGTSAVAVSTALEGLAPNTTYHYRLVASNANDDPAANPAVVPQLADGADRSFTTLPSEPLAGQPSGMTETAVTLNGEVNPDGHRLEYRFEYGTTTAYGQSTPTEKEEAEGATFTPVVPTPITGLAPGTYHYRLVAVGAGGDSYSPDATFTLYAPTPASSGNPFSPGHGTPAPFATFPLLRTPTFPPPPTETATPPKPLTKAQKLAKALEACRKNKSKSRRNSCEKTARRKYGTRAKSKKSAKRGGRS